MNRRQTFLFFLLITLGNISIHSFAQPFHVEGTSLLDPKGNVFVIRGVNNLHAWHYQRALEALESFREYNMNSVRVVWETGNNDFKLEDVVKKCLENKLIPVIEIHDATGDSTEARLLEIADYYSSQRIKNILLPYDNSILINIANEWGNMNTTAVYWKDAYIKAIKKIRAAGYQAPLVIDAPGYGQNHEPILAYAEEIINSDPLYNIMFSVHLYGAWNDPKKIEKEMHKLHDAGIPFMIGEFGYNFDKGFNNLNCMVDHRVIMRVCNELGIGYMAWSWCGNNKVNEWLDMADKRGWKNLTWWGRQVIYSEYGIQKTAKLASIFPEETPEEKAEREKREAKEAAKQARLEKRNARIMEQNKKRREIAKEQAEKMKERAELQKKKQQERMEQRRQKKATKEQKSE